MRNVFPIQKAMNVLLVTPHREIRNNIFSVLSFDPITHLFPEVPGEECALKTPSRWFM